MLPHVSLAAKAQRTEGDLLREQIMKCNNVSNFSGSNADTNSF
jgi:hypothetical protein